MDIGYNRLGYPGGFISHTRPNMKILIPLYQKIKQKVMFLSDNLSLHTQGNTKGRKLAISTIDAISMAVFKQSQHIKTKRAIHRIFEPACSYKTLVISLNRVATLALKLLSILLLINRKGSHPLKHTDATDIPVCLKNANKRVMSPFPPMCNGRYLLPYLPQSVLTTVGLVMRMD